MNLSDLDLNTSGNSALLALILLAGIVFSYFVYRKTVPPVSRSLRSLLMTLRATVTVLVLLLLFEPILSITRRKKEKPVVAVLIDQSASMGLTDKSGEREGVLRNVLASDFFTKKTDKHDKVFLPFSYQLLDSHHTPLDSISLTGDGTDIHRALEECKERLAERHLTSVVLITDGANNLGENPARFAADYGLPIYPIAIGEPSEQSDILISNYLANEIAYAGTKIPVDVFVKSNGFKGRKIPVSLTYNDESLDSKVMTLAGDGLEQRVRLNFEPNEEGLFKYEIKLPRLAGELTPINNTKSFYVKVLRSKLKVLLIAGGPSADVHFLRRALAEDENVEVQFYVEKLKGAFYRNASLPNADELSKFDCLIMLDYPRKTSTRSALNTLKNVLSKGASVLFLLGKNVDLDKLWELKDFTPLADKPTRRTEQTVYVNILPLGLQHPIFRLSEDDLTNRKKWKELPPIFSNVSSLSLNEKALALATIDLERSPALKRSLPLIAALAAGKRKSVAVFGYGLWRWDLLMWGAGKTNESYLKFLQNTVRWLSTQEDSKLVRIASNKEIYRSGEDVKFTAQVYFEDYKPVNGAEVSVQLKGTKGRDDLSLSSVGDGKYEGRFQVLEGGDYEFSGTAHMQGRILGRDSGKFFVEPFSLEFQNTRMNEGLLKQIAAESGGTYFTASDFRGLSQRLSFPHKEMVIKSEWEIWNKTPLLIACILLLSIEWLIRKRKGML